MHYIKHLLFILLLFILASCSNSKSSDAVENKKDSTVINNSPAIKNKSAKDSLTAVSLLQNDLPATISFKGNSFYSAYKWYDKTGWNLLVLSTSTTSAKNKEIEEVENSAELFARQYNLKDPAKPVVTWDMYDAELRCIFDITCAFINIATTDLDSNGIKETFIAYKTSCRSDVSPATMKLIMHEGKKKYALRGKMIFTMPDVSDTLFPDTREIDLSKISKAEIEKTIYRDWGCFDNANDFKTAPPKFLEFAKQFWRDNSFEN